MYRPIMSALMLTAILCSNSSCNRFQSQRPKTEDERLDSLYNATHDSAVAYAKRASRVSYSIIPGDMKLYLSLDSQRLHFSTTYGADWPQEQTLIVPRGSDMTITLADSTEVFVMPQSKLSFPLYFQGANRVVALTGAARFKVKEGAEPFVVFNGEMMTVAHEGEFYLSAYPGERAEAQCKEGVATVSKIPHPLTQRTE